MNVIPSVLADRITDGWHDVSGMRYRLEVRRTPADAGKRVAVRWRRPRPAAGDEIADIMGILEGTDAASLTIRTSAGQLVVIPRALAPAGKVVPPARPRRRHYRAPLDPVTTHLESAPASSL